MLESERSYPLRELVPARMVNEYIYCPRLAYLEWVQGEWDDNIDTIQGRWVHRGPTIRKKPPTQESGADAFDLDGCPSRGARPVLSGNRRAVKSYLNCVTLIISIPKHPIPVRK